MLMADLTTLRTSCMMSLDTHPESIIRIASNYSNCMQIKDGEKGINIQESPYNNYQWVIIECKMPKSSSFIRKYAENAFDNVFGKPLACRD